MKRQALRRTQNSLASSDSLDIQALASSDVQALSLASEGNPSSASSFTDLPSLSVGVRQPVDPDDLLVLPPVVVASSAPSSAVQTSNSCVPSSATSTSLFTPLPYVPPVSWPSQPAGVLPRSSASFLPSFVQPCSAPIPSYSTTVNVPSSPWQPPSWPSSQPVMPPSQAFSSMPLLGSITQPASGASDQYRAIASELQRLQSLAATLTQQSQVLQAQLPQFGPAGVPIGPNMSAFQSSLPGTVPNLFGVPPIKQSFVVGPGFAPIPHKLISSIVGGEYVNLGLLVRKPDDARDPGPSVSFDGRVILSNTPKPPRRITDVTLWSQAFSIFSLVLVTYQPHSAPDLLRPVGVTPPTHRRHLALGFAPVFA